MAGFIFSFISFLTLAQSRSGQRPPPPRNSPCAPPPRRRIIPPSLGRAPPLCTLIMDSLGLVRVCVSISEIYNEDPLCQGQGFMLWGDIDGRPWATYSAYIALLAKWILMLCSWVLTKDAVRTRIWNVLMQILQEFTETTAKSISPCSLKETSSSI